MLVSDLMTADPACCKADTKLQEVARMMVQHDCGEIPLVDETGKPIGVVTDRDMCSRTIAEGRNPLEMSAGDIMSSPCVTVSVNASLDECIRLMEDEQIRRVPVVDSLGVICGMVAQPDIAIRNPNKREVAEVVQKVSERPVQRGRAL